MADKSKGKEKRNGDGDNTYGNRKRKTTNDLKSVEVEKNGSSEDYEINIRTYTGKIMILKVKGSDTIGSVKLKIQAKEHIPFDKQELFFNKKVLENINMLADLPIKKEPTPTLECKSRGFMSIIIKTLEGTIIHALEVKPSDTISSVKAKMHGTGHVLMFNEIVLEDSGTLADFHIINGSTLTAAAKLVELMEIFVNTFKGKRISLSVKPTYTIIEVKRKIKSKEDILCDEQALIYNGMVLGDDGTLFDFHINSKSTLTLMRKSRGFMHIFINTFSGETITLKVKPLDTIESIKAKIQDKLHVPCDEQELIFNEMVLHNNDTLSDFHINKESTLTLMRLSSGFMHILVRTVIGKMVSLDVKPSDTIHNVKSKIYDMEGIPPCQQRLIWNRNDLVDSATIADYHIPKESTVHLVINDGNMKVLD